jgi:hypothetical protein
MEMECKGILQCRSFIQVCFLWAPAINRFPVLNLSCCHFKNRCLYAGVPYTAASVCYCRGLYLEQLLHVAKVVDEWNTGSWWNVTDSGKSKYWRKSLFQCHSVHHKSHMNWLGISDGQIAMRQGFLWVVWVSTNAPYSFNRLPPML